jgi:hypothetical protein
LARKWRGWDGSGCSEAAISPGTLLAGYFRDSMGNRGWPVRRSKRYTKTLFRGSRYGIDLPVSAFYRQQRRWRMVRNGETIILDSGTPTVEIARYLKIIKTQSITIITNALNIAVELTDTRAFP